MYSPGDSMVVITFRGLVVLCFVPIFPKMATMFFAFQWTSPKINNIEFNIIKMDNIISNTDCQESELTLFPLYLSHSV